ncbi:MAG: NfeD family protein [Candidatus Eremiobacteraeota bacterium]|nr:NfeD family protein [Candidatus Eremiobacteraeota bacterium]
MFPLFDLGSEAMKLGLGIIGKLNLGLTSFYLGCLVAGLVYAISLNILGHDTDGDADAGADADVDVGDVGHDAGIHFAPFSPVTLSSFISSFGAVGLITLKGFHMAPGLSITVSVITSVLIAIIVYTVFYRFFIMSQASSVVERTTLSGIIAEIITPIPAGGVGEIAYTKKGSRKTSMAKSVDGKEISKGSAVTIEQVVGSTCYVKPLQQGIEGKKPDTENSKKED